MALGRLTSLQGLPLRLAAALKLSTDAVEEIEELRDVLVERVLAEAKPKE